jgi:hypothetical protein
MEENKPLHYIGHWSNFTRKQILDQVRVPTFVVNTQFKAFLDFGSMRLENVLGSSSLPGTRSLCSTAHSRKICDKRRSQLLSYFIHSPYTVLLRCRGLHLSLDLFTVSMTPWTSDRPVARPLPKYSTAQTQNKRTHTPNIHALNGIRTHEKSVRAREDRTLGYRDRLFFIA